MARELSVIVPVLNEAAIVEGLFATLAAQRETDLELIVCDGGSRDDTPALVSHSAAAFPFPVTLIGGEAGRGKQMNRGVAASRGEALLFLHADSGFPDPFALRKGLDTLAAANTARGDRNVAGHFPLRFRRSTPLPSFGFYYYECKARLNRTECTFGDQGYLLLREFFERVGPFDEVLPFLEDLRLAETIRREGEWLLLPAEIHTSARRFEAEGLVERQTVNAVIMNFAAIGRERFLREIPRIYRTQDRTGPLQLASFFRAVKEEIDRLPRQERQRLWHDTGGYVQRHAWQVPFYLDVRRNLSRGVPPGEGGTPLLDFYDLRLDRLTANRAGRFLAACLTRLWFRYVCQRSAGRK